MIELLDRIGVRAQERRSVILFLLAVLVIGNGVWLFMRPELFKLSSSLKNFEKKNADLAKNAGSEELVNLKMDVDTLKNEIGEVPDKKKAQNLMAEINSKARRSGLNFSRSRGTQGSRRNNKDFDEEKRNVSFQAELIDLVEFLKNISDEKKSMIRVGSLNIQTTTDRKKLKVDLTFVASYPKTPTESKPKNPKTPTESKPKESKK